MSSNDDEDTAALQSAQYFSELLCRYASLKKKTRVGVEEEEATNKNNNDKISSAAAVVVPVIVIQQAQNFLNLLSDRIGHHIISQLLKTFAAVYEHKRKLILQPPPVRVLFENHVHSLTIRQVNFMTPRHNGERITAKLAKSRRLTYCNEQCIDVEYEVFDCTAAVRDYNLKLEASGESVAFVPPFVPPPTAAAATSSIALAPPTPVERVVASQKYNKQNYRRQHVICALQPDARPVWSKTIHDIRIGPLPIMLGAQGQAAATSEMDIGTLMDKMDSFLGYFIVSGNAKVLSPLQKLCNNNFIYANLPNTGAHGLYSHRCDFRAAHHSKPFHSTATISMKLSRQPLKPVHNGIRLDTDLPFMNESIPFMVIMMALGWTLESTLQALYVCAAHCKIIVNPYDTQTSGDSKPDTLHANELLQQCWPQLESIFYNTDGCTDKESALLYLYQITKQGTSKAVSTATEASLSTQPMAMSSLERQERLNYSNRMLRTELLIQLGNHPGVNEEKGIFFCMMALNTLLFSKGYRLETDIDDLYYERFISAADTLCSHERQTWRFRLKKVENCLLQSLRVGKAFDIRMAYSTDNMLMSCMSTGRWGAQKGAKNMRTNVVQKLELMNSMVITSSLQRISTVQSDQGKNEKRRQVPAHAYKRICVAETSDGVDCGLSKNFANGARLSAGKHSALLQTLLYLQPYVPLHQWKSVLRGEAVEIIGIEELRTRQTLPPHENQNLDYDIVPDATFDMDRILRLMSAADDDDEDDKATSSQQQRRRRHRIFRTQCILKAEEEDIAYEKQQRDARRQQHTTTPPQVVMRPPLRCNLGLADLTKRFVNGVWIGWVVNPLRTQRLIRDLRRRRVIDPDVSVEYYDPRQTYPHHTHLTRNGILHYDEIKIVSDAGRVMRPLCLPRALLQTPPPELLYQMTHFPELYGVAALESHGYLEYVDAAEENTLRIAHTALLFLQNPAFYTHCEIDPDHVLGANVSCAPYPSHNQSVRLTYECSISKQTFEHWCGGESREEATAYSLQNGQKPLVTTTTSRILKLDKTISGINVNAIMLCDEYNIEDAQSFSQAFVDVGGLSCEIQKQYKSGQTKRGSGPNFERFEKPEGSRTRCMRNSKYYRNLDERDGLVEPGTPVRNRDMLIGKTSPAMTLSKSASANAPESMIAGSDTCKRRDASTCLSGTEEGVVFRTILSAGKKKNTCEASVGVSVFRKPTIGDKFSSRHGQKGTIGIIRPRADLPYNERGETPDLLINPLCIHTRMTVGHVKEMLLGRAGCLEPVRLCIPSMTRHDDKYYRDETLISDLDIGELLHSFGIPRDSKEIYYNGKTGEPMKVRVFTGMIYYQRLRHMVDDKKHVRGARGPRNAITRQPTEGRKKKGGIRFGPMESDAITSHGATEVHRERITDLADKTDCYICRNCGFEGESNPSKGLYYCRHCEKYNTLIKVVLSYSTKLLVYEMMADGIRMRLDLKIVDEQGNAVDDDNLLLQKEEATATKKKDDYDDRQLMPPPPSRKKNKIDTTIAVTTTTNPFLMADSENSPSFSAYEPEIFEEYDPDDAGPDDDDDDDAVEDAVEDETEAEEYEP